MADPDVQCWSGWHTVYALLAIALLIALGLGIPCALLCSIQRKGCAVGHSASPLLRPVLDLLHEDRLPRFGAALLLRHAAVAVLTVLGERTPVVQLVLSALLSLATLVAVRRRRPWKSVPLALGRFTVNDGLNRLHTWSEGAQLFVLGLGVVVAALPASARAGVAAVACIACIACSASLVMAVVVVELGRRRRRHAGLSKQADPRNVVLELVEQGDYEQARAKGSDLGDDRLQSLVRVEIDLRGAADQLGRETEAGGASPTTQRAYQRLVARKLELMQQISPDPAEDPEEEELESEEASTQALERGVWNKAAALCQKWEALLAAWPPVQQASRTAASNALDAAASELVEQYSHARSILQERRDAVAFSLGAIEASELDHTISALEEIVATHCAHCEEASTRLFRALEDEWEPLRSCDMDDPAVLERAVARVRGATALARDGFAALERVLEHVHAQGSRHDADRLRRFHRATNWLTSYTPTLEPPAEDVTAIAARRVQALVADVQDRAVQLTEAIQRAKAAGDWKEGLRLVGEVERLRERTRSPVASACAQACVNMKPDLAVEIMRLARRQSWDLALASPVGSAGSKVEQIQSEWAEVCAKTRQLTEDALGLTKSNDVLDLQRAQDLFGIVQEAYGRFAKKYRHIPRQLAGQGAFQAAKEVNELLKTADGKAGNAGRDGVEPQPSCSATAV